MKVCKFGGSSLADGDQVAKVCDIMLADSERRVVVVSAPGKRFGGDTKVTDMLIKCATRALVGKNTASDVAAIVERYAIIQRALNLDVAATEAVEADLQKRLSSEKTSKERFLDLMKAAGEDNSARIVTEALKARGADAIYLSPADAGMILEGEAGNAVLREDSYERLRDSILKILDSGDKTIVVFPGFFGVTGDGAVATFPRGGSDITGAILAAALNAVCYENFTDIDAVFAVDPRVVPDVRHEIREMTYREMRELAYAGFGVFHDEAVMPAFRAKIPINIRNTNHPNLPGTLILPKREVRDCKVVGIASDTDFVNIYIDKYMMNREIGFGRRLLQIFEEEGIPFEHMPTGIDNVTITVRASRMDEEVEKRIIGRITSELKPDAVVSERDHAIIMIVGEGMQYAIGNAARATRALADARVNIELINQGASEISIMFGVREHSRAKAVQVLYNAFFGE